MDLSRPVMGWLYLLYTGMHASFLCTVRVYFIPRTGHEDPEESRGKLYFFFNLGARLGWVVSATPWPFCPRKETRVLIVQNAEWAAGPVWTGAKNLAPH